MKRKLVNPFFLTDLKKKGIPTYLFIANGWFMEFIRPFTPDWLWKMLIKQNREGFDTKEFIDDFLKREPKLNNYFTYFHVMESVAGHVPVTVRRYGRWIDILPIEDLVPSSKGTTYYHVPQNIEILTKNGWSKIRKVIKKSDRVLIRDPTTGRFVGAKNVREMKTVVLDNGITTVTSDHSLFKNSVEVTPNDLKPGDKLDVYPDKDIIVNELKFPPDLAWVYGLFVADGHCAHYLYHNKWGRKEKHDYSWEIANKNGKLLEKARKILESYYGIPFEIREFKGHSTLRLEPIGDVKKLVEDFSSCYTKVSRYKRVPYLILNANIEVKKSFLDGYLAGDGWVTKGYKFSVTTSMTLARGIEYLLHAVGREIGLTYRVKKKDTQKPQIILRWLKKKEEYATTYWGRIKRPQNRVKAILDAPYERYVYDVETDDGTFCAGVGNIIHHNTHPPFFDGNDTSLPKREGFDNVRRRALLYADELLEPLLKLDVDLLLVTSDHHIQHNYWHSRAYDVFVAMKGRWVEEVKGK